MIRMSLFLCLTFATALACESSQTTDDTITPSNTVEVLGFEVPVVCWSPDMRYGADEWAIEVLAHRGINDFVLAMCHGYEINGEWWVAPAARFPTTTAEFVASVRRRYPDKHVVLIVCNPGGVEFEVPDVSYATENVWVIPDAWAGDLRDFAEPEAIGKIEEFERN